MYHAVGAVYLLHMKFITPPQFIAGLVSFVATLVEGLLALRILLKLFGASTGAPFVAWVYETTQPLLNPFSGMFPTPQISGGFVLEFSSIFALMVYAFIGYVIGQALETMAYYDARRDERRR